MAISKVDLLQGTLDLLVLKVLSRAARVEPLTALRQE
jgi:hypothetical protein